MFLFDLMFFYHFHRIIVADVNDETPEVEEFYDCAMITEFHNVGDVITRVSATDKDDPLTPNGRIQFDIIEGNDDSKDAGYSLSTVFPL